MNDESFRDSISTVDQEGKRKFIFPKKPSGKWYEYRKWVSYFLLFCLFSAPFIKVNGNQLILFNVLERRFNFFGFPFGPQDFYLVAIGMVVSVVFVVFFTVVFGRIFCGWICPQTIFMEMVFRRIEYWIEGDRGAQIRLEKQAWNAEKWRKKLLKWTLFFIISFAIANVFLAYIVGSDHLRVMVQEGPMARPGSFIALLIFTGVFYFVYAWFREQVCIIACPYGRLQGVLLDDKSINVAYDFVRGEGEAGRAKFRKGEDRAASGKGDCIDCMQCVHVCPMGIDIRNGIQLECTNCTACIDECNTMMTSVGLPKGLIRYASEVEIAKKEPFKFTLRMKGYTAVLLILVGILAGMLFLRSDVEITLLRVPGQLFEHKGENISNVYTFRAVNKTVDNYSSLELKLMDVDGTLKTVGKPQFSLKREGQTQGTIFIEIPEHILKDDKINVSIGLYDGERLLDTYQVTFMGPRVF